MFHKVTVYRIVTDDEPQGKLNDVFFCRDEAERKRNAIQIEYPKGSYKVVGEVRTIGLQ